MNPEIKAQWVAALRSGDYVQGRGRLRTSWGSLQPHEFCCLGVLCDLAAKEGQGTWLDRFYTNDDLSVIFKPVVGLSTETMLPRSVAQWAGMTCKDAEDPEIEGVPLSGHNDDGKNFKEIADLIDRYL
jgi:hypothetical protein